MVYYPRLQQFSPLRPVDWRWRRAQKLVSGGRSFSRLRDDAETGRLTHYLRLAARGAGRRRPRHARAFPDLHAACRLHEHGGALRLELQARLLAAQPREEIAGHTGVPREVIDAYQATFFH